jgi:hypothetical protein
MIALCGDERKIAEVPMPKPNSHGNHGFATRDDVTDTLGQLDGTKLLAIMSLRPTIADLAEASLWLAGDADIFGACESVKGTASKIVTILTEDEDEEAAREG